MNATPLRPREDYDYSTWEVEMALRYPLALSEMRWPSERRGSRRAWAAARWGIECQSDLSVRGEVPVDRVRRFRLL